MAIVALIIIVMAISQAVVSVVNTGRQAAIESKRRRKGDEQRIGRQKSRDLRTWREDRASISPTLTRCAFYTGDQRYAVRHAYGG